MHTSYQPDLKALCNGISLSLGSSNHFYSASLYNLLRKLKAIIKKKSFLSIIVKVDWHKVTKIADTN